MKKLIILGALTFASLSFAKTTNNIEEYSNNDNLLSIQKEQIIDFNQLLAIPPTDIWWEVTFTNACGQTTSVFFQSGNTEGSPSFNAELAYAVNTGYSDCLTN